MSQFADFMRELASRLLNQSELARDAAIPQPTVHRHLNLLGPGVANGSGGGCQGPVAALER